VLAKPFLSLEEKFEVRSYHTAGCRIQHHHIPVIPSLQPSPTVRTFEITFHAVLHLLPPEENFGGILSVRNEPVTA
jgi:hypothetical protein